MNINRHNYESFFLLYIDNELCAADRNAVELFVLDNADLKSELYMLQQSIVQPDLISFKAKNNLLKPDAFTTSTEEKLLLYIDRELSVPLMKELETLMAADDRLSTELGLLQQTKLSVDSNIIFADKHLLYREEQDSVIPFGWWKLAAAVVIVGFGLWGMKVFVNKPGVVTAMQVAAKPAVHRFNSLIKTPAKKLSQELIVAITQTVATEETSPLKKVKRAVQIKEQRVIVPRKNVLAKEEKIIIKPSNNLPKSYFENSSKPGNNQDQITSVTPQTQQNTLNAGADKKTQTALNNNNVYTAAFSESANDTKEDRFTFSDDEPKKSRIAGLLRKAKRLLERNTKMKTGDNNVKVANLEFALQ
ncbi:hypothetical protein [Ferruginibacter sp.]|uniref:hypothetical protein n=1 Tax=Ferruginibacter sp. TaxID=1940288 RepID=UPI0019C735D0|nr:hypothetical protein [Ferruginibacter sp.]MBC7628914.1 hypothetical protein [Ferruginibacter sp.]